ncbi:hypothetical protein PAECIP111891_04211 [Paenibacillus allorhizoplanae]|uniref:Uncharacterized protein n=1 Tax=Paenibacillus allorhizoplanae TaxID=2905648 RepID=A0ABM9CJZ0_9BACL|nr:hypothetical protein PAECIP111891_04211 [Paenibacillus allorhizoplanae]
MGIIHKSLVFLHFPMQYLKALSNNPLVSGKSGSLFHVSSSILNVSHHVLHQKLHQKQKKLDKGFHSLSSFDS